MSEGNDLVLDQLTYDIKNAMFSTIEGIEYRIYSDPEDPSSVIIEDKVNDELTKATVDSNDEIKLEDKGFSKSRSQMFLVDGKTIKAYGWASSLGYLKLKNPSWKLLKRSELSSDMLMEKRDKQLMFTRTNGRYVVLNGSKFVGKFNRGESLALVSKNPGYTMIEEVEYNKMQNNLPVTKVGNFVLK